jgi:hypothetical protein
LLAFYGTPEGNAPSPDTANLKRSSGGSTWVINSNSNRRNHELWQWAGAVVNKALPKIVRSLVQAAESLDETPPAPLLPQPGKTSSVVGRASSAKSSEEPQDESLAALLLRLLRSGENSKTENSRTSAVNIKENSSLG